MNGSILATKFCTLNPFVDNVSILYPLKIPQNLRFKKLFIRKPTANSFLVFSGDIKGENWPLMG